MADTPFVSLYRRFRPGRFDEIRGQDHVVRALRSAVRDDRVSHAYLFSGPRGTGKTSSARILAKALNCEAPVDGEPCGTCTSCVEITQGSSLNVHELDAASNNGVDAMRDLVAHASLGTPGRWKVYIVDEVHMLSTAAANALLKTLEEPPSHVVFVLATTDPQKVPPTIRSRTQHLEFRLLGAETLHGLLESVNEEAGLNLEADALEAAVRRGRGSARDALSALDQVAAAGSADAARPELAPVLGALADGDVSEVLVAVSSLLAGGWGPQQLATELIDDLRQVFLAALAPGAVCRGGIVARAVPVAGRDDGAGPGGAQHGDPGPRAGRHARGARRAGRARDRRGTRRAARPRLGDGGAVGAGERPGAFALGRGRLPASRRAGGPCAGRLAGRAWTGVPGCPVGARAARRRTASGGRGQPPLHRRRATKPVDRVEGRARPSRPSAVAASASESPQPETAEPAVTPQPAVTPEPTTTAPPAASATAAAAGAVDRDSLTEAWGDGILRGLPARAKARYASGRFVAVDQQGAHFALPNAAHRDQCAEHLPLVEAALAAHFGMPVTLVLDVDDADAPASGAAARPGAPPGDAHPAASADVDDVDPADLALDAPDAGSDQASAAQARLLEAFPGASEVAH